MANRTGFLFLMSCVFCTAASAQSGTDRAGTWEVGAALADFSSVSLAGQSGAALSVGSELGYGFTVNYNITNRLALGGDLMYSSPDYEATRVVVGTNVIDRIGGQLDVGTIHLKGTFYFTEGKLAPLH